MTEEEVAALRMAVAIGLPMEWYHGVRGEWIHDGDPEGTLTRHRSLGLRIKPRD